MNCLLEFGPYALFRNVLAKASNRRCLVLGAGGELGMVSEYCSNVGVNLSRDDLKSAKRFRTDLILCDARQLPLRPSCVELIVCKSTLHHLGDICLPLSEWHRVLQNGSLVFLFEPGMLNFIAFLGRKLFPTDIHEPSENPLNPFHLRKALTESFEILNETEFFMFVHLLPILAKYVRITKNIKFLKLLFNIDTFSCKTYLKNFSWIMTFTLRKK